MSTKLRMAVFMKNYLFLILFSAIIMICVPLAIIKPPEAKASEVPTTAPTAPQSTPEESTPKEPETISVFLTAQQETVDITLFEYVCGSVAAEMPLAYDTEAIKAQAVACYTNAVRLKNHGTGSDGDISDNTAIHQGYINEDERREKWGNDFEKYEKKLQDAVRAVEGLILTYEGKICVASFYAISSGHTETAKNIWGTDVPYLVSVESAGDHLSSGYASSLTLNTVDFYTCLTKLDSASEKPEGLKDIIKITSTSPSGTVLKATVNGKEYTGEEIRSAFGLRSPVFTIKSDEDTLTFSVSGYGHGVGMSQYGADYYAKQGYTYEQILSHYYPGTEITPNNT